MDPVGPPPPLSAVAVERLSNCVARMGDSAWLDPGLGITLGRAEDLLCALHHGCSSLRDYLQLLSCGSGAGGSAGSGGGPCTRVWTAGTIAYRWARKLLVLGCTERACLCGCRHDACRG